MSPQPDDDLPLTGIRVIDVATVIAAPYCAGILGEFGAEVLKVEHPVGGDVCRHFGTRPAVAALLGLRRRPDVKKPPAETVGFRSSRRR